MCFGSDVNCQYTACLPSPFLNRMNNSENIVPSVANIQQDNVYTKERKELAEKKETVLKQTNATDTTANIGSNRSPASSIDYTAALNFGVFEDARAEFSVEKIREQNIFTNHAEESPETLASFTQTTQNLDDDKVYAKLEKAFRIECLHANMKKHIKRQEREMIKLRGQLIKLRTRDAIMQTKMNDTNEQLQSQTMRYNDLCQEIQQVVSMAACVSVVPTNQPFLSPQRTTRYSFSATMEGASTPKLPMLPHHDESFDSPVKSQRSDSEEDDSIVSPVKKSTTTSAISIPTRKYGMDSPDVPLTPSVRIVGGMKIKKEDASDLSMPPPPLPNQRVRFAASATNYEPESYGGFSYVDAMRMLMSPNTIPEQSFVQKTIHAYGTTPLTNEQNDFKTIIAKAEVNNMNKKISVIKKMYQQENSELKRRMEVLESHLSDKDSEVLRLKQELAQAREMIREQDRVLKSTKTVMSAFSYDGSTSSGTEEGTPQTRMRGGSGSSGVFPRQRRFSGKRTGPLPASGGNKVTGPREEVSSSVSPANTSASNILGRRRNRRSFYSKIGVL